MAVIRERRGTGVHGVVAQNDHTGCCAAARSAALRAASAVPTAAAADPSTATTASGFVLCCPHCSLCALALL